MKKAIALFIALLPFVVCAQSFVLTADGFRDAANPEKPYIVVEVPGTQAELYNKAKTAVTMIWKSAKDVMSYSEPEVIIVNGFDSGSLWMKRLGMTFVFDFNYRLQFQFKDGKIRIDAPSIDEAVNKKVHFISGKAKATRWLALCTCITRKGNSNRRNLRNKQSLSSMELSPLL